MKTESVHGVIAARSNEGNGELRERLSAMGISSTTIDTICIAEPDDWAQVDRALEGIDDYDWVAFTSPRAVPIFAKRLAALKHGARPLKPRVAAVGSKTAAALVGAGFGVHYTPEEFLTSALARGLPSGFGRRVLLLRADIADESLADGLARRGFEVTDVAIYLTHPVSGLVSGRDVTGARVVAFASPSEVRGFKGRLAPSDFRLVARRATAACIGPVTAEAARAEGFTSALEAEEHTVEGLVELVKELVADA